MAISYPASLDTFTTRNSGDTISEDHMNDVQDAIEALEIKVGVDSSAVATSLDYLVKNAASEDPGHEHTLAAGANDVTATSTEVNRACDLSANNFFGTGRAVYFWEDTAPTGWTIDATGADCVLAVKGGAQDYNVAGGTKAASSWTVLGFEDHCHQWYNWVDQGTDGQTWDSDGSTAKDFTDAGMNANGAIALGTAQHGRSNDGEALNFDAYTIDTTVTVDGTWRPPGAVGIIATKDA